jgi:hypothetical protein
MPVDALGCLNMPIHIRDEDKFFSKARRQEWFARNASCINPFT